MDTVFPSLFELNVGAFIPIARGANILRQISKNMDVSRIVLSSTDRERGGGAGGGELAKRTLHTQRPQDREGGREMATPNVAYTHNIPLCCARSTCNARVFFAVVVPRIARESAMLSGIMRVVWARLVDCRGSK